MLVAISTGFRLPLTHLVGSLCQSVHSRNLNFVLTTLSLSYTWFYLVAFNLDEEYWRFLWFGCLCLGDKLDVALRGGSSSPLY